MIDRVIIVLASALSVAGCTAGSGSAGSPAIPVSPTVAQDQVTTHRLTDGVTVEVPAAWFETRYRGEVATVVFPLTYLSTTAFAGPCASGAPQQGCGANKWFPSDWTTPSDRVIVLWLKTELPNGDLSQLPGQLTTVAGRPAKVWAGNATSNCPAGAATEVDAYVQRDPRNAGTRIDMRACLGGSASASDRDAVQAMLNSLHITS